MATTSTERVRAMRARRRAAIEAADAAVIALRPADHMISPSVEETLTALDLKAQDAAVAALARHYARVIDRAKDPAWAARWLMPLLADCLAELGATPMARAKLRPAGTGPRRPNRLDALRQAHVQQFPGA